MTADSYHQSIEKEASFSGNEIAIIGMACRLPGAESVQAYWENLKNGVESIETLSKEALIKSGVSQSVVNHPDYVLRSPRIKGVDQFDPGFFGMSAQDASIMDPQHRHFLEVSWEALESAGIDPERFSGLIGCYGGSGYNAYMPYHLLTHQEIMNRVGFFLVRHTGNDKDFLTTRVSYAFNLKGPSINVQTACSTSLVAIHMASQSLLNGECDAVIAGGTTIELPEGKGYFFKEGEILAKDGHCKPFEASSTGTLFGSGIGVVVLMRLDQALQEGHTIHAVIKGSAVNNDGSGKVSYLAPSVDGQASVITEALTLSDIDPESISFVECHGTGTAMGDPIEVEALTTAFQACGATQTQFCAIGSVKSNIGHLDTAAGAASIIKVALSLQHKMIPPTLHYEKPNPNIEFQNSPFYVNNTLLPWNLLPLNQGQGKRRASVSSLGVGGTNAHVILEEAPSVIKMVDQEKYRLFIFSAKTANSLQNQLEKQAGFIEKNDNISLADMAYTLKTGRKNFTERKVIIAKDKPHLVSLLRNVYKRGASEPDLSIQRSGDSQPRTVAFMYAGGGAQYPNMGRDLYASESVYRDAINDCLSLLKSFIDYDLKALLFPEKDQLLQVEQSLERPSRSLPALFVTQYAQTKLLQSLGVQPQALVGHSLGENTAACIAGVISLKDALGLVSLRGKLFEKVPAGGMLSVQLSEEALRQILPSELSLACINASEFSVVSGPQVPLDLFQALLEEKDILYTRIRIQIAAHSSMLEGILSEFGDYLRSIRLNKPLIPFLSNLTGTWIKNDEAMDPNYWVKHLRHTVRFSDNISELFQDSSRVLVEVGPGRTLTRLAHLHAKKTPQHFVVNSMRHVDEEINDSAFLLSVLGNIWSLNAFSDWKTFYGNEKRYKIPLPTYSFDHKSYWIKAGEGLFAEDLPGQFYGLTRQKQLNDWLYHPSFVNKPLPTFLSSKPKNDLLINPVSFLILCWQSKSIAALAKELVALGHHVMVVELSQVRTFDFQNIESMTAWFDSLLKSQLFPTQWLFTLAYEQVFCGIKQLDTFKSFNAYGVFQSFFNLAKAMSQSDLSGKLRFSLLTLQGVSVGFEKTYPMQSLMMGSLKVLESELSIPTKIIDISSDDSSYLWKQVAYDLCLKNSHGVVALRHSQRFLREWVKCDKQAITQTIQNTLRDQGVYLITGGLGGLGLLLAQHLSSIKPLRLVLVSRKILPPRHEWESWINKGVLLGEKIKTIQAIEALGSEVWCAAADVTSIDSMQALTSEISLRWGDVNGIFHVAGSIEDELISLKSWRQVESVLAPKIKGAQVLNQLWASDALDFMLYFSSVSALSGLPGQFDYAAANAYLDALSVVRTQKGGITLSVNWPAWQQVGMAADVQQQKTRDSLMGVATNHPALDFCLSKTTSEVVFATECSTERLWMFNEHRLRNGQSLIPGTAYLELARAAYKEVTGIDNIQITQLTFNLPFALAEGEVKALYLRLKAKSAKLFEFIFESKVGANWLEHARGNIEAFTASFEKYNTVSELLASCQLGVQAFSDADHHPFLHFGDRWRSLKKVHKGNKEALIELACDALVFNEMKEWKMHPAFMDVAIAGAQTIIPNYQPFDMFYVPAGYECLRFSGDIPQKTWAHVRLSAISLDDTIFDSVYLDITLFDEFGQIYLQVFNFLLKKLAGLEPVIQLITEIQPPRSDEFIEKIIALGVAPNEGMNILTNLLSSNVTGHIVVSPYYLNDYLREVVNRRVTRVDILPTADSVENPLVAQIESALRAHVAIADLAVKIFDYKKEGLRTLVFYQVKSSAALTGSELRRFAQEHLAKEEVPHQFLEIDTFAKNMNGDIDRAKLQDPQAPVDYFAAPRTHVEKELAKIWQAVLGVEQASLADNFLDAGGHSLLGIRLITRVEKNLGVRLNQGVLALQTLEQIAKLIEEQSPISVPSCLLKANEQETKQVLMTERYDHYEEKKQPIFSLQNNRPQEGERSRPNESLIIKGEEQETLIFRSKKLLQSWLGNK